RQSDVVDEGKGLRCAVEKTVRTCFTQVAVNTLGAYVAADAIARFQDDDLGFGYFGPDGLRRRQASDTGSDNDDTRLHVHERSRPAASSSLLHPRPPPHPAHSCACTCRSTSPVNARMNNGDAFSAWGR